MSNAVLLTYLNCVMNLVNCLLLTVVLITQFSYILAEIVHSQSHFSHIFKPPLTTSRAVLCIWPVHLFVCLSVCRQNTKARFSQKLSNLEPWCVLMTYRKSYIGFTKNLLLDP